ncbi:ribose-phosphate diphosphokinase [Jeotgalibaca sp. A122]|uniref:ribose-phosphate diphosphokinase n=1 Tax=Jeotgalibaca sp. A122 TaxID=3457322 RepID=UPI003FD61088
MNIEEKPEFTVFSLNSNRPLAEKVAKSLNIELGKASIVEHSDGETKITIQESVRGKHVFLIQSTTGRVNENIMETLIMMDALKRASALTINIVLPYYAYARQDRKAQPREPITAKLVADLLQTAGADRVIALDLHAPQIQGFFDIPVDHLSATSLLAEGFLERGIGGEGTVVVAPNHSGVSRGRKLAEVLKVPLAIVDKRTKATKIPERLNVIGDVAGKICILFDDLVDTGTTVAIAALALKEKGAKEIYVAATHAVFSKGATELLESSVIEKIIVTDSIYLPEEKQIDKVIQVSVADLLAYAINCVYEEKSLHQDFE